MGRYKDGHKSSSREEIVRKAAARFRKEGIAAVGVRPVMADAGLTHGAFYAHFPSRSELVSAATSAALEGTFARLAAAAKAAPGHGLEAIVSAYLRPEHRDHPELGCAAAALAPEIARESYIVRDCFTDGLNKIVDLIADNLPPGGMPEDRSRRAYAIFALLLGTLQLMRIATSPDLVGKHIAAGRDAALAVSALGWDEQLLD